MVLSKDGSEAASAAGRDSPRPSRRRVRAPRQAPSPPSKNWIFVVNNPLDHDLCGEAPKEWYVQSGAIEYTCFAYEFGESGTAHIQGYLRLKSKQRRSWLVTRLCSFAHWEPARGSFEQNRAYVYKAADEAARARFIVQPQELGAPPQQGKRSDIEGALQLVRDGASDRELFEEAPIVAVRHLRAFQQYRLLIQEGRNFKTYVHVMWGPTGTGKSARARIIYHSAYDVAFGPTGLWWDGYDGAQDVWIDDFKGGIALHMMLRLMDRYAMHVAVRGANINFGPRRLVITASSHPRDWYDWQKLNEDPEQLLRRVDRLEEVTTLGEVRDASLQSLQQNSEEELYSEYSGDPEDGYASPPTLSVDKLSGAQAVLPPEFSDSSSPDQEVFAADYACGQQAYGGSSSDSQDSFVSQSSTGKTVRWPADDISEDDESDMSEEL